MIFSFLLGFSIANYRRPYQATDVIFKKLPRRQLVFLAKRNDMLVMTYLKGALVYPDTYFYKIQRRENNRLLEW